MSLLVSTVPWPKDISRSVRSVFAAEFERYSYLSWILEYTRVCNKSHIYGRSTIVSPTPRANAVISLLPYVCQALLLIIAGVWMQRDQYIIEQSVTRLILIPSYIPQILHAR